MANRPKIQPSSNEPKLAEPKDIIESLTRDTLTARQKEFLDLWFSNGNVIARAVASMGLSRSMENEYGKFLREPKAKVYLQSLKDKAADQAQLSTMEVIVKTRRVYDKSIESGDYKAALAAADLLGKYLGMNVDRTSIDIKNTTFQSGDKPQDVKQDLSAFQDIINKAISKSPNVVKLKEGIK